VTSSPTIAVTWPHLTKENYTEEVERMASIETRRVIQDLRKRYNNNVSLLCSPTKLPVTNFCFEGVF
jgi:hypothetical protein